MPSRADPPALPLALEPDDPDLVIGVGPPLTTPDGHTVSLGQWSAAGGTVRARCDGDRTALSLTLEGLVPNGVYTVWLLGTTIPLGYDGARLPTFFSRRDLLDARFTIFLEPAGTLDGREAVLTAGADGRARFFDLHGLSSTARSDCLTAIPSWFVLLDYHADGRTYGPVARPEGAHAASHLLFAFRYDRPLVVDPP